MSMSDEAQQIVKKLKQLDKRIGQFRANDQRILKEGGPKAQGYMPMAPRHEREKEKLIERLRNLEARLEKDFGYRDPDTPSWDEEEGEHVEVLSRQEELEEFQSPPTQADYQTGWAGGKGKRPASTDDTENSQRVADATESFFDKNKGKKTYQPYRVKRLPEPSWEGMGPIMAGFFGAMALTLVAGYFWIMGAI